MCNAHECPLLKDRPLPEHSKNIQHISARNAEETKTNKKLKKRKCSLNFDEVFGKTNAFSSKILAIFYISFRNMFLLFYVFKIKTSIPWKNMQNVCIFCAIFARCSFFCAFYFWNLQVLHVLAQNVIFVRFLKACKKNVHSETILVRFSARAERQKWPKV